MTWRPWAALLLPCLGLLPFFYAFAFCSAQGDDFDSFTRAMFLFDVPGALYEVGREWLTWSGRYVYHFLSVLLGRATGSPAFQGPVCGLILLSFGLPAYIWLRKETNGPKAALAGLLWVLAICACYEDLPNFYLYTDALTICLQASASLLFFVLFCDFASGQRGYGHVLFAGIFAIGVYEYSAFFVFWACLGTLATVTWANVWKRPSFQLKEFLSLFLWLGMAECVALLAPGNFARKAARPLDSDKLLAQLQTVPESWFRAMTDFFSSPWLLPTLSLALFYALCLPYKKIPIKAVIVFLFCFCGFTLTVILAQACSDAPFGSSPKFAAALNLYAAFTIGCIIIWIIRGIPQFPFASLVRKTTLLIFFLSVVTSANFIRVSINALNGELNLFGAFIEARETYLKAKASAIHLPPMGIYGEIVRPDVRKREFGKDLPVISIPAYPLEVFPVWMGEALQAVPDVWPNTWAGWRYGVGKVVASVSALPPNALMTGSPMELILTPPLKGLRQIRLFQVAGGFAGLTGVGLEYNKTTSERLTLLMPLPLNKSRPLPIWLQEFFLSGFLQDPANAFFAQLCPQDPADRVRICQPVPSL